MSSAGVRGADPDALAELARALDVVADAITELTGWLRTVASGLATVPAIDRMAEVVRWCDDSASTARRVALLLLSEGRDWREHRGFWGNMADIVGAEWRGIAEGTAGLVRGGWNLVEFAGGVAAEPAELVWAAEQGDIDGVGDVISDALARRGRLLRGLGQSLWAAADAVNPVSYAEAIDDHGFWRATEDRAESVGQQLPAVALTVATSGLGAAAGSGAAAEASLGGRALSGLGTVAKSAIGPGNFDPHYVTAAGAPNSAIEPTTQALTMAVDGNAGHWVGLDPATGDFVVTDGNRVTEKRWRHLSDAERDELRDRGLVDEGGRLIGA